MHPVSARAEVPRVAEPPSEGAIALPVIEQDGNQFVPVFTLPSDVVRALPALVGAGPNGTV